MATGKFTEKSFLLPRVIVLRTERSNSLFSGPTPLGSVARPHLEAFKPPRGT